MTDEQIARACSDLLGMRWAGVWPQVRDDNWSVQAVGPDVYEVGCVDVQYTVNLPTLMVAALLRHAGSLDVGPCEKCGGNPVEWGYAFYSSKHPSGALHHDFLVGQGWAIHSEGVQMRRDGEAVVPTTRPCPACRDVNGKPTGRERVPAWRAVLMVAPRPCSCEDHPDSDVPLWECDRCERTGWLDGHEGVREALAQLADGWESCAAASARLGKRDGQVAADLGLSRGVPLADLLAYDGPEHDRWLHPCPDLGAWVLAWLTSVHSSTHYGANWGEVAPAIRAHLTAAWARGTVECGVSLGGCGGTGKGFCGWCHGGQREPGREFNSAHDCPSCQGTPPKHCQRCAGLGRVREENRHDLRDSA